MDLLQDHSPEFIGRQLAIFRRLNTQQLPVIYTVRTTDQGGKFNAGEDAMFNLLLLGARRGCEYIDVESCWDVRSLAKITALKKMYPNSFQIISSYHHYASSIWEHDNQIIQLFKQCHYPGVDIVKGTQLQTFSQQT